MKRCMKLASLCLAGVLLLSAGCSRMVNTGKSYQQTVEAALTAIYTCPNEDIVAAYDVDNLPPSDDAVQSNPAADEAIKAVYGEYFTEQALEQLASSRRASQFHFAADEGGYTMSISNIEFNASESNKTDYDFTATVSAQGVDTAISGMVQFSDDKISSMRFYDDVV